MKDIYKKYLNEVSSMSLQKFLMLLIIVLLVTSGMINIFIFPLFVHSIKYALLGLCSLILSIIFLNFEALTHLIIKSPLLGIDAKMHEVNKKLNEAEELLRKIKLIGKTLGDAGITTLAAAQLTIIERVHPETTYELIDNIQKAMSEIGIVPAKNKIVEKIFLNIYWSALLEKIDVNKRTNLRELIYDRLLDDNLNLEEIKNQINTLEKTKEISFDKKLLEEIYYLMETGKIKDEKNFKALLNK